MGNSQPTNWQESLAHTYEVFASQFIAYAPQLIGALALLIFGWIVAHGLRIATKKLIKGFDSIFQRAARTDGVKQEKMKRSYAVIISKVVFWTVILFFIAASGNMLGWKMFSTWMSSLITYLPNLITGVLIILAGFLFANGVRVGVLSAAGSAGLEHSEILARMVQIVILFTALVIGVEQIGINMGFLSNTLIVIVGVLLAGGALAFSLGARTLVANIIGAQYVRKHCRVGEQMQMGDVEGRVVEVTQTSVVLDTEYGRTIIPAKQFQESICSFKSEASEVREDAPTPPGKEA